MIIKNAKILKGENQLVKKDVLIKNGKIAIIADEINKDGEQVIDANGMYLTCGAVDVHAHLREPGFTHKETVATGTLSAAKGGITTIMAMPNLNPTPDTIENLQVELDAIEKDAVINVYPFASVSKGEKGEEISDLQNLSAKVKGFTDDGVGVNNLDILEKAMEISKEKNIPIASHAEFEGYGTSEKAEYLAVEREIKLQEKTNCPYHFCHMSTKESFEMIEKAMANGQDITCEVTPHHLFLNKDNGVPNGNFKMNPPLRSSVDMNATLEALLNGIATIIATDHAPHTEEEKQRENCPNGIIGFETMLPLLYTKLVTTKLITLKQLYELTCENPAKRFSLPYSKMEINQQADLILLDLENPHTYTSEEILSKSTNTPFLNQTLLGFNKLTLVKGEIVYKNL